MFYKGFVHDTKNENHHPAGIYMLKVNNRNIRTRCEICSKLLIKIQERRQWRRWRLWTCTCRLRRSYKPPIYFTDLYGKSISKNVDLKMVSANSAFDNTLMRGVVAACPKHWIIWSFGHTDTFSQTRVKQQ